ncbi:type 1 fimbrial protein [Providencia manganoxydans]|uniref:type 1 fimbrial protein n=1 Tax=Providencia manganoxydans TaxID=2923283 RepID=UPI0032DACB33
MKDFLSGVLISSLLIIPFASLANTVNLQVNGDIKAPTCNINGVTQTDIIYDMGRVNFNVIPQTDIYMFPVNSNVTNNITVTCDAATFVFFDVQDTYASSTLTKAPSNISIEHYYSVFHLVDEDNTASAIGGTFFRLKNMKVDNDDAYIAYIYDFTKSTSRLPYPTLFSDGIYTWSIKRAEAIDMATLASFSKPGKEFSMDVVQDNSYLLSREDLAKANIDTSKEIKYKGEAVLIFKIGL